MKLADKVEYYRRCEKYDRIARKIKLKRFDYEDTGMTDKAERVLRKIKKHNKVRDENRQHVKKHTKAVRKRDTVKS